MPILAYHITWTTYGTWLHGDNRGWVKTRHNGVQKPDRRLINHVRCQLAESPIELTIAQRELIEATISKHCAVRNWPLHAVNARTNHIHVVVTADRDCDEVMNQLKAWCSRKLSDDAGLTNPVAKKAGRRRWFTEDGDKELIEDEEYLRNEIIYVLERQ